MPKKVLVIGSSLREKSNSETPADAFAAGAQSSGTGCQRPMKWASQRALRLTAALNSIYHEPDELTRLFSELIGKPVGQGFRLFPPFYTNSLSRQQHCSLLCHQFLDIHPPGSIGR